MKNMEEKTYNTLSTIFYQYLAQKMYNEGYFKNVFEF